MEKKVSLLFSFSIACHVNGNERCQLCIPGLKIQLERMEYQMQKARDDVQREQIKMRTNADAANADAVQNRADLEAKMAELMAENRVRKGKVLPLAA